MRYDIKRVALKWGKAPESRDATKGAPLNSVSAAQELIRAENAEVAQKQDASAKFFSQAELVEKAKHVIDVAESRSVHLRLFGSLAIKYLCDGTIPDDGKRKSDIDLFGRREDAGEIIRIMKLLRAIEPDEMFNKLQLSNNRLKYELDGVRIDVMLDEFKMCHTFNFKDRLDINRYTLPITDLVMTKLQIVWIVDEVWTMAEKDFRDLASTFLKFDFTEDDSGINLRRITELCNNDWGVEKTFTINLGIVKGIAKTLLSSEDTAVVAAKVGHLIGEFGRGRKSIGWRMRARVGDKARWYEEPEAS